MKLRRKRKGIQKPPKELKLPKGRGAKIVVLTLACVVAFFTSPEFLGDIIMQFPAVLLGH